MRPLGVALVASGLALSACANGASLGGDDHLTYVALGDSFTSGPLVPDQVAPPGCYRSNHNYPHLVAAAIDADEFRDVSCGGSSLDHLTEPHELDGGDVAPPQIDALDDDVDVVTIGMGGNDVGFVSLALECINLQPLATPCSEELTADGDDRVADAIEATAPEMRRALRAIHDAAPDADVFVIGYPAALPDDEEACWPYVPILQADMTYLVERYRDMNHMLEAAADDADATFVDTYESSIGHDACQRPGEAWVNGVVVIPPSFPAHPNALGFENTAREVTASVQAGLS